MLPAEQTAGAAITVITMRCAGDAALGHKLGKPRLGRPIAAAMGKNAENK